MPTTANDPLTAARPEQTDTQEQFYQALLDELSDGVYFVDPNRRITFWNKGAERITGFTSAEVVGKRCLDNILVHVDEQGTSLCLGDCPLAATMRDGRRRATRVYLRHKDGHRQPVWTRTAPLFSRFGQLMGGVETFGDAARRDADVERLRKFARLALVDTLTGIPNRRYLESVLAARFAECKDALVPFGVILIDVDHFKRFNDVHGHDVGDRVLRVVAETLASSGGAGISIGRWGGEEFLAVVSRECVDDLQAVANRYLVLVRASSVEVGATRLGVTVSIGATLAHADDDAAGLIRRADECLYKSKATRNCLTFTP